MKWLNIWATLLICQWISYRYQSIIAKFSDLCSAGQRRTWRTYPNRLAFCGDGCGSCLSYSFFPLYHSVHHMYYVVCSSYNCLMNGWEEVLKPVPGGLLWRLHANMPVFRTMACPENTLALLRHFARGVPDKIWINTSWNFLQSWK